MTSGETRELMTIPSRSVARCQVWRAAVWVLVGMAACSPAGSDVVAPIEQPGDASQAGAGQAGADKVLCGGNAEPCCALPLLECAPGGTCNRETALCEASTVSSVARRLCRSASDCQATEACCEAGLVSTCVALVPNAPCPTIDLAISADPDRLPSIQASNIAPLSCESGCLNTTGRHRTLAVGARVLNMGSGDLLLGAPGSPGVRVAPATGSYASGCTEYGYAEDLVRYELIGADGSVYSRADARLSPGCRGEEAASFGCGFLGLTRNVYSTAFGCDQLPIDGVAPGDYTLRLTIDPNDRIAETDENNNVVESPITLSRVDLLSECPPLVSTDLGAPERDCGWTPALAASCTPGEVLSLGCPTCPSPTNDPFIRVCAGSEACFYEDAIATNDDEALGELCPKVTFPCPTAGAYASFVGDYTRQTGTCDVTRLAPSAPP